ncbi:transcriptional regulator NrdR [Pseudobacteriovorax antillogorgiicola]|uniref:Transcriptional repressor NrdR n=1 Tax=Pseudobacteriovorax antillogorgiicola TaxID=1513793 RepID=A0A1Y6CJC9_9BACT|nr:transcriptional regulator NrdR [Pseudobacteriovorax antillogorgiicola]TCS46145.1 transcriptional repressor NrdR [Pseudobacteriovorax antillogorgiicola]SMF69745.1 transcriptional repressor NrdR [Pseudobacteriovorax antillogorgiicola]
MKCPKCDQRDTKVLESRISNEGRSVRRRRVCTKCHHRFTTYEKQEELTLQVKKRDGTFDVFNREKIISALSMACRKRNISIDQIESMVAGIEAHLRGNGERTVTSQKIGDLVMKKLRQTDHVAYVRFASIYKDFKDPEEFLRELKDLKDVRELT